jgi:hypothetical protein
MAELEIHTEAGHHIDPLGQRVGVLAAVLAVVLAIVTIASHRTHTSAIMHKSTANDAWSHYQATRVKYHNLELGESLIGLLGAKGASADAALADYATQKKKYDAEGKQIQDDAQKQDDLAGSDENRGLRYDVGEGLLEIGLVLSSLFFISKKKMFPVMGLIAGVAGSAIAITGLMI